MVGLSTVLLYWSLLIAWSSWLSVGQTRQSILAAIKLLPDNSLYYRFWAELEPRDRLEAYRQAAAVNPMSPEIRIELGLSAEKAGNLKEAEASLVKAVALERTGAPRGILAEYYFRHHQPDKFWLTARDALHHQYLDPTVLFEDSWKLSPDNPGLILARAIPDDLPVLTTYLNFLLETHRLDPAGPVADRIMSSQEAQGAESPMMTYCDRLLEAGESIQPVRVWNWLSSRKFVPYPALEPQRGQSLTNGAFTFAPLSRGFDWRLAANEGLNIDYSKQALDITFNGKQPENCEVISQFVPLEPDRAYTLRARYEIRDIDEKEPGLSWKVFSIPGNQDLLNHSGGLPEGARGEQQFSSEFTAPGDTKLARLVLMYERVKGTVRIEGSLTVRKVELTFE